MSAGMKSRKWGGGVVKPAGECYPAAVNVMRGVGPYLGGAMRVDM